LLKKELEDSWDNYMGSSENFNQQIQMRFLIQYSALVREILCFLQFKTLVTILFIWKTQLWIQILRSIMD